MVSTIVRLKGVSIGSNLFEFLTTISKFAADIVIWRSMKRFTIDKIVDCAFYHLPQPFDILCFNCYKKIETSSSHYLRIIGGLKEIFLKNLSKILFVSSTRATLFNNNNNFLIDGGLEKCVCNETRNSIFLWTWIWQALNDDFLLNDFVLWLYQLHLDCKKKDFINRYYFWSLF